MWFPHAHLAQSSQARASAHTRVLLVPRVLRHKFGCNFGSLCKEEIRDGSRNQDPDDGEDPRASICLDDDTHSAEPNSFALGEQDIYSA